MLLPQEIAEQLKPNERMDLSAIVEETWGQAFGIIKVTRSRSKVVVEIELDDKTRHEVSI